MKNSLHILLRIFLLSLPMFLVMSCEKEAKVDIGEVESKIVVLSEFTPDEAFVLDVSKSKSVFSDISVDALENAEIKVCKGIKCELLNMPTSSSSENAGLRFISKNLVPELDIQYSLEIKADGIEPLTAMSSIPSPVELSHVALGEILPFNYDPESVTERYEAKISLRFSDPVGIDNYYQVNFYQELLSDDGNLNIDTNWVSSVDYLSIDSDLIDVRNITDDGILINGDHFDGVERDLLFQPIFEYDPNTETPINLKIELRSVSREYFNYYTSVYRQVNQGSDPFIQPVEIVSNVNNGLGLFAGYSKDQKIIKVEL